MKIDILKVLVHLNNYKCSNYRLIIVRSLIKVIIVENLLKLKKNRAKIRKL